MLVAIIKKKKSDKIRQMIYRKITVLFIKIILLFTTPLFGQDYENKPSVIDKKLLRQDFLVFRANLEKIHPALYRYKSKNNIDYLLDRSYNELNRNMTEIEFYAKIKFDLSAIEDGHLSSAMSAELKDYCERAARLFPVEMKFIKNNAFVFCDNSNPIPRGSKILKINDETIENIRQKLYHYIVSDGSIETKKARILSNNFWFYYLLVYGEKSSFKVEYITTNGKIETTNLNSNILKNIECKKDELNTENNLQLKFIHKSTACLTIKTFSPQTLDENKENFVDFLKSSFAEINREKIDNLIIDLRENGGGKDVYGSLLYSYLTDKPFPYYKSLALKTKILSVEDHPNLKIQKPNDNNFKGNVFVLTTGMSFSTTSEFCAIAKSNNRAVFIGEETGGGYYGNNSGDFEDVVLPNTKIVVTIPTKKYIMDVKAVVLKDRGIIPDFEIQPEIGDIINKRDKSIEFVLQLIDKNNSH